MAKELLPDALWARIAPLLPPEPPKPKGGRPPGGPRNGQEPNGSRERLVKRMVKYFDSKISHQEMRQIAPSAMQDTARFMAESVRDTLRKRGFQPENVVRYCYRPLDIRWLYWESETKLLDEKRSEYFPNVFPGNVWIEARQKQTKERFDRGYVITVLGDNFGNGLSTFFPLSLRHRETGLFVGNTWADQASSLWCQ